MSALHAHPLLVPVASSVAATTALVSALLATDPGAARPGGPASPERIAVEFVRSYRTGDYAAAAALASGRLRDALQARERGAVTSARELVIEESSLEADERLRLSGVLAVEDAPDASGWPISLTLVHARTGYRVEALHWPNGAPPDER